VDTSTSWGRRLVTGINDYTRKHGPWQMFVEARGLEERIRVPRGWDGEGIIARIGSEAMARDLHSRGLPVVNVSAINLKSADFPRVTSDMQAMAELAAAHFLERGFEHFAYFGLRGLSYTAVQQATFIGSVRRIGADCAVYEIPPHAGAEPDWNLDLEKLAKWLRNLPKPVAVFTWNADSGRQVIYAAHRARLHVPEEVAVLSGADDDLLCEVSQVPISAVLAPAQQVGYRAAELLHRLMSGRKPFKTPLYIPPLGIVTRQSTDTLAVQDRPLLAAIYFIRENAHRTIRVADVARHSGIARRALERRFARHLERSVGDEIRRVHFDRAKKLLVQTDMPVSEVSEASGFGTSEYLAHVFKRQMKLTPLGYRRQIRGW
jgi:LacI family transcriptional regulator